MTVTTSNPCPDCGAFEVDVDPAYTGFDALCLACYDGAPDATPPLVGHGDTAQEAMADWEEQAEDMVAQRALDAREGASCTRI